MINIKTLKYPLLYISLLGSISATQGSQMKYNHVSMTPCKKLLITASIIVALLDVTNAKECFPKVRGGGFAELEVEGNVFINASSRYVNASFEIFNSRFGNLDKHYKFWRYRGNEVGILVALKRPGDLLIWAVSDNYKIKQGPKERTMGSLGFTLPQNVIIDDITKARFKIYPNPTNKTWDELEEFEKNDIIRVKDKLKNVRFSGESLPLIDSETCQTIDSSAFLENAMHALKKPFISLWRWASKYRLCYENP